MVLNNDGVKQRNITWIIIYDNKRRVWDQFVMTKKAVEEVGDIFSPLSHYGGIQVKRNSKGRLE